MNTIPDISLRAPRDWYLHEVHFAVDAHEFTTDLQAAVHAIFRGSLDDGPPLADRYRQAAQLIACTRNTCGGPNAAHDHQPLQKENPS